MSTLPYVPKAEFDRLLQADVEPVKKTRAFAAFCRVNTLYMIRKAGSGHIGSSFSSLDIVAWIFLNELRRRPGGKNFKDVYFSSKGHDAPGLYSVMLGLGLLPFHMIHALRRLGGLPGHPDVQTPGIPANTGSLGMGISKAKGMIAADRIAGGDRNIFVMTGDGELQEGQIWESLISAASRGMGRLTVLVDHNKLQSDIWVEKTSDLGDMESKFRAFGWHVQSIDGHDHEALGNGMASALSEESLPSVIIADTIKGKGAVLFEHRVSREDKTPYGFHSGAPDMDTCVRAMEELVFHAEETVHGAGLSGPSFARGEILIPSLSRAPQRLVEAYSRALLEQGEKNPNLVVLDADLKADCGLIPFEQRFPKRFMECGIAEQDMVSQAGGMALSGLLPAVHSFACFLTTRANEQIFNNATEKTRIIYVGSLAGMVPGGPGHSHQSVRDIAVMSTMPGLTAVEPCCEEEVAMLMDWAVNHSSGSTYMRLVSIPCEITFCLPGGYEPELGRGAVLSRGDDALLVAYGPVLVEQAWQAARILAREGVFATVAALPWLNTVDQDWLAELIQGHGLIMALDNHLTMGGQGWMLASALSGLELQDKPRLILKGLESIPACGFNHEVLKHHGMDAESLAHVLLQAMNGNSHRQ